MCAFSFVRKYVFKQKRNNLMRHRRPRSASGLAGVYIEPEHARRFKGIFVFLFLLCKIRRFVIHRDWSTCDPKGISRGTKQN